MPGSRGLGAWLVGAALVAAGCAGGGPSAVAASPSPSSGATSTAAPASPARPSASVARLPADIEDADAACRRSLAAITTQLTLVVSQANSTGRIGIVYANPERDHICIDDPAWSIPILESSQRLADSLGPTRPIVRPDSQSYSPGDENYVWGAVAGDVARVTIEASASPGGNASTQDAALSNGYFLAMLSPGMPCCIFTAVAYSAAGTEIGRLGGP